MTQLEPETGMHQTIIMDQKQKLVIDPFKKVHGIDVINHLEGFSSFYTQILEHLHTHGLAIVVVSGRSGSGKDTVLRQIDALTQSNPEILKDAVSAEVYSWWSQRYLHLKREYISFSSCAHALKSDYLLPEYSSLAIDQDAVSGQYTEEQFRRITQLGYRLLRDYTGVLTNDQSDFRQNPTIIYVQTSAPCAELSQRWLPEEDISHLRNNSDQLYAYLAANLIGKDRFTSLALFLGLSEHTAAHTFFINLLSDPRVEGRAAKARKLIASASEEKTLIEMTSQAKINLRLTQSPSIEELTPENIDSERQRAIRAYLLTSFARHNAIRQINADQDATIQRLHSSRDITEPTLVAYYEYLLSGSRITPRHQEQVLTSVNTFRRTKNIDVYLDLDRHLATYLHSEHIFRRRLARIY